MNTATNLTPSVLANAWRDDEYLESLSAEVRELLPANPAGEKTETFISEGEKSTFISNTCSTFISDCCGTFISNTCSTFISDCCGSQVN